MSNRSDYEFISPFSQLAVELSDNLKNFLQNNRETNSSNETFNEDSRIALEEIEQLASSNDNQSRIMADLFKLYNRCFDHFDRQTTESLVTEAPIPTSSICISHQNLDHVKQQLDDTLQLTQQILRRIDAADDNLAISTNLDQSFLQIDDSLSVITSHCVTIPSQEEFDLCSLSRSILDNAEQILRSFETAERAHEVSQASNILTGDSDQPAASLPRNYQDQATSSDDLPDKICQMDQRSPASVIEQDVESPSLNCQADSALPGKFTSSENYQIEKLKKEILESEDISNEILDKVFKKFKDAFMPMIIEELSSRQQLTSTLDDGSSGQNQHQSTLSGATSELSLNQPPPAQQSAPPQHEPQQAPPFSATEVIVASSPAMTESLPNIPPPSYEDHIRAQTPVESAPVEERSPTLYEHFTNRMNPLLRSFMSSGERPLSTESEELRCPMCSSQFTNRIMMEQHFDFCGRQ